MSIVRQLVQICSVQAMRGQTLAKNEVLDSTIKAIEKIVLDDGHPVIVVSIEEMEQSGSYENGFFDRPSEIKMIIQTAVTVRGVYEDENGADATINYIGETDAACEAKLNIIDRQWRNALSDPNNVWADRFRTLAPLIKKVKDMRLTDPESGRKYAARLTEVTAGVISEPDFGCGLPDDIAAILTAVGEIPDYAEMATIWTKIFEATGNLTGPAAIQSAAFLSSSAMGALGLAPLDTEGDAFGIGTVEVEGLDPVEVTPDG